MIQRHRFQRLFWILGGEIVGRVWQYGYSRDIVRLFVVTIIVGSVLAWGAGWIVDSFFGDTVHNIVGDVGEYDVILQVRDGHGESTQDDLHRIMDQHLPGSTLREGVSIAGQIGRASCRERGWSSRLGVAVDGI